MGLSGALRGGLGGTEGMGGGLRPTAVWQGLPVGALTTTSSHSGSMSESPPYLTFISFISDPLRPRDKVLFPPPPHLYAGKVPLWAS